jgi:hypothetical protein
MAINQDNVLDKLIPTTGTLAVTGNHSVTGSVNSTNTFGFKNRLINGAMMVDQRNNGASVTNINGANYSVDRFGLSGSVAGKFTGQQISTGGLAGFPYYLATTSLSAYTPGASEYFIINQRIESYMLSDLAWGTSSAKTITLSFWVYTSLTGTFGGSLQNGGQNRNYPFSYSVSAANTWTPISITIPGDTTGTWLLTGNGTGIQLNFGLGVGSTYSGTAGAWSSSYALSTTGATSVVSTNGATFYITGVQLEVGTQATSFDYRPYGTELILCQRYYWKFANTLNASIAASTVYSSTRVDCYVRCPVTMRATPSMDIPSGSNYFQTYAGSYSAYQSTWLLNVATPDGVQLYNSSVTGFTEGRAGWTTNSNANAYIAFSAEL